MLVQFTMNGRPNSTAKGCPSRLMQLLAVHCRTARKLFHKRTGTWPVARARGYAASCRRKSSSYMDAPLCMSSRGNYSRCVSQTCTPGSGLRFSPYAIVACLHEHDTSITNSVGVAAACSRSQASAPLCSKDTLTCCVNRTTVVRRCEPATIRRGKAT